MSEPSGSEPPTEWRVVGLRRWIPLVAAAGFLANAADDVAHLVLGEPQSFVPRSLDLVLAVLGAVGFVTALVVTVVVWRTRVALRPTGVEVRAWRRRLVAYGDVTRAYRSRFTSGAVTLLLTDDRIVRLPAPVAGLGTSGAAVDEALEQVRARLPAA